MIDVSGKLLSGSIIEDETPLTLNELCAVCSVSADRIREMVKEGILEPSGSDAVQWRFSGTSLRRVRVVCRLQRDLDVNLPGAALVVELLEEIERMNSLLRRSLR